MPRGGSDVAKFGALPAGDPLDWRAVGYGQAPVPATTTITAEMRLADAEGGIGCVATASGTAAWRCFFEALLSPDDELVVAAGASSDAIARLRLRLTRMGVRLRLVDALDIHAVRQSVTPATRALFVESVATPNLDVPDFWPLAEIANERAIPFVVDNTVATPALLRPADLGADVVLRACGISRSGHGAALGGAIVDTGRFDWSGGRFPDVARRAKRVGELALLAHVRAQLARDPDAAPSPWTAFLMLRELENLAADVRRQCENARYLAVALQTHPALAGLDYPGLESSPSQARVRRYLGGQGGGLLGVRLGSEDRAFRFLHALDHVRLGVDVDRTHTTASHVASMLVRDEDTVQTKIPEDLVLLSAGTETFALIVEDIRQALRSLEAGPGAAP